MVVLPRGAVLHTTKGDITLKLFPDECPRTVENFTTHAKNCYYDGVIFHRIIKGFMLQTGDPLGKDRCSHGYMLQAAMEFRTDLICVLPGDGTGGESIWGGEFEDEFHKTLRHDRPGILSMANAGELVGQTLRLALWDALGHIGTHWLRLDPSQWTLPLHFCRPRHQWFAVLHHHGAHTVAGQQTHRLWEVSAGLGTEANTTPCIPRSLDNGLSRAALLQGCEGHGCGLDVGEGQGGQARQALRGHQDLQHHMPGSGPNGILGCSTWTDALPLLLRCEQ